MLQGAIMRTKVDADGDSEVITKPGVDLPTSADHVYDLGALRKRRARRQPAIWPLFIALAASASVAFLLLKCFSHLQVNLSRPSRALAGGDDRSAFKKLLSQVSLVEEFFIRCKWRCKRRLLHQIRNSFASVALHLVTLPFRIAASPVTTRLRMLPVDEDERAGGGS